MCFLYIHIYMCMYLYIHMCTYIHTYIHIYTCMYMGTGVVGVKASPNIEQKRPSLSKKRFYSIYDEYPQ